MKTPEALTTSEDRRALVRAAIVIAGVIVVILMLALPARAEVIGGRPAGCPQRYCGCALALKIYGSFRPHLHLAANWLRLPRAAPQAGMVAARSGHVMQLIEPRGRNIWLVYDPNSTGGKIRIHERRISNYVIVNPRQTIAYNEND